MGKYSHLELPKFLEPNEGQHRDRVNKLKQQIASAEIEHRKSSDLVTVYAHFRKKMDEIKEKKATIQVELDAYSEMIADKFEEEAITSLKLETGASLRIDVKPIPVMKDREMYRVWCVGQGLQKEMHLHSRTTESLVCNLLIAGRNVPPGIEAFMKDKIVFTKAK